MENNASGFALGFCGGISRKEDYKEQLKEYERRKANADKVEAALMKACGVIAERMERDAENMSNTEISHAIGTLAGIATILSALGLYTAKPICYGSDLE